MTTIVYKDGALAWDTQTTWQGRGMTGRDKVFTNGPVTFGVAGLGRVGNILRHMDIPALKEYEPGFDARRWVTRELCPAILAALKEADAAEIVNSQANAEADIIIYVKGDRTPAGEGLVGYLSSNLSFVEDESGFYGVGSGSPYALGALHRGASAKEAVETAIFFDLYSGGEARELRVDGVGDTKGGR